ncbi:hypothetical protein ACFQFH_14230 [Halobaculum halobium]|uniref:hypothetical protein n=1 Tax=Halobaculum halobium TaxID=3032281 RepID=UPI003614161F
MSNDARGPAGGDDGGGSDIDGPVTAALAVVRAVRAADATFVAGSLAYYSGVATLPVAVLAAALVTQTGDGVVAAGAVTAGANS